MSGFTKQHWQNLKDVGLFSKYPTYEDWQRAKDEEERDKTEGVITPDSPKADSVSPGKWQEKIVSEKDFNKYYRKVDSYELVRREGDKCVIRFFGTPEKVNLIKEESTEEKPQPVIKKENYQTQMMSSEALPSVHDQEDTPEEIADQERVRQRFQEMREANEPIRLEDIPF